MLRNIIMKRFPQLSLAIALALSVVILPVRAGDVSPLDSPQAAAFYVHNKAGKDMIGRRIRLSVAYVTPVSGKEYGEKYKDKDKDKEIKEKTEAGLSADVEVSAKREPTYQAHTYIQNQYAGTALVIADEKEAEQLVAKYGTEKPEEGRPVSTKSLRGEFTEIKGEYPVLSVK